MVANMVTPRLPENWTADSQKTKKHHGVHHSTINTGKLSILSQSISWMSPPPSLIHLPHTWGKTAPCGGWAITWGDESPCFFSDFPKFFVVSSQREIHKSINNKTKVVQRKVNKNPL